MTGRWVYDAAHEGWNELHPVYAIQKIDPVADSGDFDGWRTRWCDALSSIPPFDGLAVRPSGMSPQQSVTYDNQVAPEKQWFFHPVIDGCTPAQPALR